MPFRILCGLFSILISITYFVNWNKSKIRLTIKKVFDCFIPLVTYWIVLYSWHINEEYSIIMNVLSILIIFSLTILFISQIKNWNKYNSISKIHFTFTIINIFICICISFSLLNIVVYKNFPYMFESPQLSSVFEIGFEFLYYTFTLMFTYSDSSISVAHTFTKLLQMIEISAFYITIGIGIADLIEKHKTNGIAEW